MPGDAPTPTARPGLEVLEELHRLPPEAARTLLRGSRVYRERLETNAAGEELRRLPPVAARTLLLGSRVYRKRLETNATGEDATTIADAPGPAPPARPTKRRRLHFSPDHTLVLPRVAVVAEVPSAAHSPSEQTQEVTLGPARPAGDRPPGARGPPRSVT